MLLKEERKKLATERCARSVIWRSVHALGSLDLAILLLISLAGVCAIATFLESGFSARVARAYVYNAPWFNVWLLLLALNLTCSAATRALKPDSRKVATAHTPARLRRSRMAKSREPRA